MYFSARLEIDPSQMTVIKQIKPSKLFGKLLHALTLGSSSEKQEHETFTAVTILQQINMSLRSIGIRNVIRLAVDEYDFYYDEKGIDDDLLQAIDELSTKIDPIESEIFNTIYLVLEHKGSSLMYLVELSVQKNHRIGEYPIKIKINGAITDFKLNDDETKENLENRMKPVFKSQESYDIFIRAKKSEFDDFVDRLELAMRKFIKADDVQKHSQAKVIRPKGQIDSPDKIRNSSHTEPIFYGYPGFDSLFFYSWLWGQACFARNLMVQDFDIVDETGNDIVSIGESGFKAGESDTLNPAADFEAPAVADAVYHDGNQYSDYLRHEDLINGSGGILGETVDNGWLDIDYGAGDGFNSTDSYSSCGGCSSGCT